MGDPLVAIDPDQVIIDDKGIEIIFSNNRIDFNNSVPLRVLFRGSAVVFGTIFSGTVWDTQSDILGQPVLEGDANFDVSTNSLRVALTQKSIGQIVRGIEFIPSVFTPNGDGINDVMNVKYTVIQISEPKPVKVAIYDLAGSLVRTLADREQIGGIYTETWDGKNDAGEVVPPGNYIVLLEVKSGTGIIERVGAIAVAY
jgi:gliding motility-associated-like protein